ncbi:MAG: PilZ domain-containing protein [Pseudomonadota bacterium]
MTAVRKQAHPDPASSQASALDQRLPLRLDGRYLDEDGGEHRIASVALSCRSAQIAAHDVPNEGSRLVCYFEDLGRVVGVVARKVPNGFLLRFEQTDRKRDKLADQLVWLMNKDTLGLTDERASARYKAGGAAQLRLKDGGVLNCRVVDISLTGAGFEAFSRAPAIGDIVSTGNLRGEVVRSQGRSFGVRFIPAKGPERQGA